MRSSTTSLHRRLGLVALPVIVGLIAVGCSDSTSHTKAAGETTVVTGSDGSTSLTSKNTTTTSVKATTTTKAPNPQATPTPSATLADPPVQSTLPPITLHVPTVTLALTPVVKTMTAKTSWTCAQATAAGKVSTVSWTTANAAHVLLYAAGYKQAMKFGPNASADFWLVCGTTTSIKITPFAANGDSGVTKTLIITVAA